MKVRCDRARLIESLNSIVGIVPANSPKPVLGDFLLATEEGSLVAEATDMDISGKALLHTVEVQESGRAAVPSARLVSILKEIPDESVELHSRDDPPGAIISGNGFEFRILGHDPDEFPAVSEPETPNTFTLHREKLHDALKRVSIAASRDTTRYQLNGVFLEFEKGKVALTATDGKRLTHDQIRVDGEIDSAISAILPNQAIDVFLRILSSHAIQDETVTLSLSETHVNLHTKDNRVSSNLVDGIYPNYRAVFPPESRLRLRCRKSLLLTAARSASLTTDKSTQTVLFRITTESMVLESQAQDIGEARVEIPIEATGDAMEVRFNPVFFIDALRTFEEDEVQIELTDPGKPALLRGTANYRHLVMPLVNK